MRAELAAAAPDERVAEVGGQAAVDAVAYVLRTQGQHPLEVGDKAKRRERRRGMRGGGGDKGKAYLDGRASAHADWVVEVGVGTAFLSVDPDEVELVPHSVDEAC